VITINPNNIDFEIELLAEEETKLKSEVINNQAVQEAENLVKR